MKLRVDFAHKALEGLGVGSAKRQPDGTFRILWTEVGLYDDLVTGAIPDTWTNPDDPNSPFIRMGRLQKGASPRFGEIWMSCLHRVGSRSGRH